MRIIGLNILIECLYELKRKEEKKREGKEIFPILLNLRFGCSEETEQGQLPSIEFKGENRMR